MKRELRLLLTSECNYNCFFCHREGVNPNSNKEAFIADDYAFLYDICNEIYPSDRVTISGGEPLIRNDIGEILTLFRSKKVKLTLVTNGSLLKKNCELISKNVDRINISLHTLDCNVYKEITKTNVKALEKTIDGIIALSQTGNMISIRFNITLVKGVNDDHKVLNNLIDFAQKVGASIKFIELYPKTLEAFAPLTYVENYLLKNGFNFLEQDDRQIIYKREEQIVALTQIFCAFSEKLMKRGDFCKEKQDLFITPTGGIKICMNNQLEIPIKEEVINRDDLGLSNKILKATALFGNCNLKKG